MSYLHRLIFVCLFFTLLVFSPNFPSQIPVTTTMKVCYTILEQRLDTLKDEQEDKLADDLLYLFRECEKYSDISQKVGESDKNEAYSFDMVTNKGINVRTQTYVLPEKDKQKADELEKRISQLLSGDSNVDICTLLSILNKKIKA